MEIKIIKTETPSTPIADESTLGFGVNFTDHMFLMDYTEEKGWHDARIVPYGPIPMMPSCSVLHYGCEIFEGLKAYRTADGSIQTFRIRDNIRRMNDSAERLCLPQLDVEDAVEAINTLVKLDERFVPHSEGTSLYIRPFTLGMDRNLGVHGCKTALFCVILSPSGSYYKEGINPVRIMIETEDVRTVRGGTGYAKCGGNYAASLRAGERAAGKGYTQVLWLDGVERKYIEEVGSMNVMFKIAGKIVTPALTGSVLPGITRRSCVQMLKDKGYEVEERLLSVQELEEAAKNGTLEEAWGTGTAAVVSPIGELCVNGEIFTVSNGEIGAVTAMLYEELTGIQYGKIADPYGWTAKI
ncbi:MAG: branched-chain amino acid aminotransferase [Clostridia bacterium]|nr:branched-chain amino acid aminotransferase [Clostridia bacterium]